MRYLHSNGEKSRPKGQEMVCGFKTRAPASPFALEFQPQEGLLIQSQHQAATSVSMGGLEWL